MDEERDVVIVGGGAAGLSAAQMLGRSRRRVLVVDGGQPRNRFAAHVHGVLGHDGTAPETLLAAGRSEAAGYGVEIVDGTVERLVDEGDRIRVVLVGGQEHRARAVVLATGVRDDLPDVPGLADEWGRTVLHCPYCHGWEVAGRRLGVLATSSASLHQAELVRQLSDEVTVFSAAIGPLEDGVAHRFAARGVRIVPDEVVAVQRAGDGLLLRTRDGGEHAIDALFTGGVPVLDLAFADGLDLVRTDLPGRPLQVDAVGRTSHRLVFAAGNAVQPYGNVPHAMSTGSMAGAGVNAALAGLDFDRAVEARAAERASAWEQRYVERGRTWSGAVNATVAALASGLEPGTALDVGAGEGGDVVWLAEHGWRASGVDVSATALQRAADLARARGVEVDLHVGDGAAAVEGVFDLVLAGFLHSWEPDFPRLRLLRDAAGKVAPGGCLIVVSHAAPPPWAEQRHDHAPALRTPEEELVLLALDPEEWTPEVVEARSRRATAPDGSPAELEDGVLLLRRRG